MVQRPEFGSPGSFRGIFPLILLILLPYLLFLVVGAKIASPDVVSLTPLGDQPCRGPVSRRPSALLAAGKAFSEEKQGEAWASRLRRAASLPIAGHW